MDGAKQSKRAGRAHLRNGGSYDAYEALAPIECAECGETIRPGDRFVRVKRVGGGRANFPHCQECEPHLPGNVSAGNQDSTRFRWRES